MTMYLWRGLVDMEYGTSSLCVLASSVKSARRKATAFVKEQGDYQLDEKLKALQAEPTTPRVAYTEYCE